jgi:TRAP-type C4-dicarboxylate transport system permease small subunit
VLAWFKKSPDKKKQRDKMWRAVVLIAFILVLGYNISSAWHEAMTRTGAEMLLVLRSMQFGTYLSTVFIVIHVWQRWRLTFSYFRRSPSKKAL